jgi:hypothetical protein
MKSEGRNWMAVERIAVGKLIGKVNICIRGSDFDMFLMRWWWVEERKRGKKGREIKN